jgi:hypothetical protein
MFGIMDSGGAIDAPRLEHFQAVGKGLSEAGVRSGGAVEARDLGARLGRRKRERIHRGLAPALVRLGELPLDDIGCIRDLPGSDRERCALQGMGRIHPHPDILAMVDGAQMPHALLGKKHQQFPFEVVVAAGLTGEMVEIYGGLGHGTLCNNDAEDGPQLWPFCFPASAPMVNEALTTFVNPTHKWVSKGLGLHYPSNW